MSTIIQRLGMLHGSELFCKREDLLPYSFGGNKARKAALFFQQIDTGDYNCVVSYGSGSSNHCRVVSNLCAARGMECILVSPLEAFAQTNNLRLTELFGARRITVPVQQVHDTIETTLQSLRDAGKRPYFIPGGGHGNLGTQAYVDCFREILQWEREQGCSFDEIYFASGTGTTQAGLICGKLMSGSGVSIRGVSIARQNPRGREVVLQSVRDYLASEHISAGESAIQNATVFLDNYTGAGYGSSSRAILETMRTAMIRWGLPLDVTYTAKAFYGMEQELLSRRDAGTRVLFLHTGGHPLFFDDLQKIGQRL